MIIINAKNTIAGRLAAFAAKQALLGEEVRIINAEQAVISGDPKHILAHYQQKVKRGTPSKGPFFSRMPDRFLRRIIRGMLPYKKPRGREAYERILCYVGTPPEFEGKETVTLELSTVDKLPTLKYITIKEICSKLGGKA
ncbi:50S ribosomal protein L13 [Candidatus Woesearchaeota archaeon]|nr:MAG: 50S ribosomal protein L13 [Candidatus Woesearchaeota archaeon]